MTTPSTLSCCLCCVGMHAGRVPVQSTTEMQCSYLQSSVLIKLQIGKPYTHARERLFSRRRSANRTIYDVIKLDNRQLRACAFIHSIVVNFNLKNL
ncbi:hypothetical protein T12_11280 [Trichinella patagoniensis]|uniref:Uncharacterized protein n=1 Tax=Trichinella patagoniensis TaxID=990121 RepID=A0A0V0ZE41_9BILA|nr:hypothetical protein T12_11280 [Trichinella patagoniensis]